MSNTSPSVGLSPVVPQAFQAFNRSATVTVGNLVLQSIGQQTGLDFSFTVKRSLEALEPNTCDLKIWNLSEGSRQQMQQASQKSSIVAAPPTGTPDVGGQKLNIIPVQIDAGYVGHTSTIFLGEMSSGTARSTQTVVDGADTVTELNSGDGDTALTLQRISAAFSKGSTPLSVVQALLAQMGVGNGNVGAFASQFNSADYLFQRGVTLKGNAAWHLDQICAAVSLEFSVQSGAAQFLKIGQALAGEAYSLSPSSGLVGSPTVDTAGICSFVTFIIPGIVPGAPVEIDSAYVQGDFRILSVEYEGSTFENEWYCKCESARYGVAP